MTIPRKTKDAMPQYEIGEFTYGTPTIAFGGAAPLTVGKYCSFADGITIYLGGNHRVDWVTTYPFTAITEEWPEAVSIPGHPATRGGVTIGNDVWIGSGATIMSGTTIGDGAVVAARAVVAGVVEPYSLAAGNPARHKKYRFSPEAIESLLRIRWWDWPVDKVKENMALLCNDKIDEFIKKHEVA